jgi:GTPase-associated protein 1, N-terminal domain type 1
VIQGHVHQLLHGYRNGHCQLEASLRLVERDSELVTRLSDLSGNLASGIKFETYLTVYPLPSRKYFAVARTWPDPDAPRAGCVLTHTILVPIDSWAVLPRARSLDRLFRNPRLSPAYEFTLPVELSPGGPIQSPKTSIEVEVPPSEVFVSRYFGKGIRPVVWFSASEPEECLWRLLEHLWPKLRSTFSCCTFSLQQRTLEDGPFDLLFAPSAVYSRFTKLSPEHLIEPSVENPMSREEEPWYRYWAKAFFSASPELPSRESELPIWSELSEDPTAIRKLSLVHELRLRAPQSPMAGVGAIDVVESLARDPKTAISLKRQVFEDAIRGATAAQPARDSLTTLRLIEDRLHRESFRDVAPDFEKLLSTAAAEVTKESPEAALEISEPLLNDSVRDETGAFVKGVMKGLCDVAQDDPSRLTMLRSFPDVAATLFRQVPVFGATYLEVGGEAARRGLTDWLSSTSDTQAIRIVRESILASNLKLDDPDLLSALLRRIDAADVTPTLFQLSQLGAAFATQSVRQVVTDRISSVYPNLVRKWAENSPVWSPGVSEIVASTYAQNRTGFNEFLATNEFSCDQQTRVLSALLQTQLSGGFPYWLQELIAEDSRVMRVLLRAKPDHSAEIIPVLNRVIADVPDLPLSDSRDLLHSVLNFSDQRFFAQLRDSAMRSVVKRYVRDAVNADDTHEFSNHPSTIPWFATVSGSKLGALLVHSSSSGAEAVSRALTWTADAPGALYKRQPSVLPELCDSLLSCVRRSFPPGGDQLFAKMLRRSRVEADEQTTQALSGKLIRFALDNVRLPLGSVVAEAFADVYAIAVRDTKPPSFLASLFGAYDWDKAKDLRVSVLDAFLRSAWSAGDLAIAANNAGILRKIFKRLHRTANGDRYATAMYQDLVNRNDPKLLSLTNSLKSLLANPDFYEDWD